MAESQGLVLAGVEADLAEIAKRDPDLARSGLAATARQLAAELDDQGNSATSKSMCAKALMDALETLRALMPPATAKDKVDEVAERRARRREAAAKG